jgi:hypothetical protein
VYESTPAFFSDPFFLREADRDLIADVAFGSMPSMDGQPKENAQQKLPHIWAGNERRLTVSRPVRRRLSQGKLTS